MLTVIVSTRNGHQTLPIVLASYLNLEPPEGGWKLVVVDNGSTDDTPQILRRFQSSLQMTLLTVESPGKNRALNVGLDAREGDLVVFTDDDAIPAPNWLVEMRRAADVHIDFDVFGGAIRPRWDQPPQIWHLHWVSQGVTYTITDPSISEGPALAEIAAWGPNMAIRARLFDAGHRFDEQIGPEAGISYRMGSETEFTRRMEQQGSRAWFVPTAIVEHIIRSHQMERSWVLARAKRFGQGQCYIEELEDPSNPNKLFGLPRYRLRRVVEHLLRHAKARLMGDSEAAFREMWAFYCEWGYLSETKRARADHSKEP